MLQKVLEQFSDYERQAPSSGVDYEIASEMIMACRDDLLRYKTEIEDARQIRRNKADTVWKRIRPALREKTLQRMQEEIHRHVTKLGHQLNLMHQ